MTGPEHYQRAESLLKQLRQAHASMTDSVSADKAAAVMAEAQVHATLALTAATAMQAAVDGSEPGMGSVTDPGQTTWGARNQQMEKAS